jgi:hypothetical protein
MAGIDLFELFLRGAVLLVYGSIIMVSTIFTFSLEAYRRLDECLGMGFFNERIISPVIEGNINAIDDWLIAHNRLIGPWLILISFIDIVAFFKIIDLL